MADRYAFQSPFSRGSGSDPWFTAGSVAVTTTVAVTAMGLIGVIATAINGRGGSFTNALALKREAITGFQIWRFLSWPIPAASDPFWALLGLVFFYMIGTQFEGLLGRRAYTSLVGAIVVIPSIIAAAVSVMTDQYIPILGLSLIFLGIAAGFGAAMPQARSFFGIPFWGVVAFIFLVQFLGLLDTLPGLAMLISTAVVGLVMTKSLGFANVEWIPTVPLPSLVTGSPSPTRTAPSKKKRKRSRGRADLKVVPTSSVSEAEIDSLLDQVSEHGLDSLSKQQKQTLDRHAKEMRKRRDS